MGRHAPLAASVAAVALAVLAAWALPSSRARRDTPPRRPNVVLISLDTARRDHMSFHGYGRDTTPHLRRLMAEAGQSVVFEQAVTVHTNTAPAHGSMMTGLYPTEHGIRRNGMTLRPEVPTLAQRLGQAGYATGAFVSGWTLTEHTALDRGFDVYDDEIPGEGWRQQRTADATWAATRPWLHERHTDGKPFFLFFHLFDPHHPYDPPAGYARRFLPSGREDFVTENDYGLPHLQSRMSLPPGGKQDYVSRYDGEIAHADHYIGKLLGELERLGLGDDTLVLFVVDHGETLIERPFAFAHGGRVYDEQMRVPFIVRLPRARGSGPRRVRAPVSHVDLMPTVLDWLDLPAAERTSGRSLVPLLTGRRSDWDAPRPLFANARPEPGFVPEIRAPIVRRGLVGAIRLPSIKLIEYPMRDGSWYRQLFDLQADPGETRNLAEERPELADRLHRELERWRRRTGGADRHAPPELSTEVEEALRALGYVE